MRIILLRQEIQRQKHLTALKSEIDCISMLMKFLNTDKIQKLPEFFVYDR